MISVYYPHLPDSSGAEAHRTGLLRGFEECNMPCVARNQFSRWDSLLFFLDAIHGKQLYIRMNGNSRNVQIVLKVLHWFGRDYILEVNAPHYEDESEAEFYCETVRKAKLVVCVSLVLKSILTPYNRNVLVVSNGGVKPTNGEAKKQEKASHFLFIFNTHWNWQSADNIDRVVKMLEQHDFTLKIVDVAGFFKSESVKPKLEVVSALSPEEYSRALEEASGFYIEYRPIQDSELGFYGDSLKFRDYWNSGKPILVSGPKMEWAPNPQSAEFGVFTMGEFAMIKELDIIRRFPRHSYTWVDVCSRILNEIKL